MRPSKMGSGDSGAAGAPNNSAIKIPSTTNPAPFSALDESRSCSTKYEVITANTGSNANKIAAWLAEVYCCAQSCTVKATAVANTGQIPTATSSSQRQANRTGCQ